MLKVISSRTVEPKGTRVTGSKDMVSRQIVTRVHTSDAWTVEFILKRTHFRNHKKQTIGGEKKEKYEKGGGV